MTDVNKRTSEEATVRLKVEIMHCKIADSMICNKSCLLVARPVCFVPRTYEGQEIGWA
jgi:hypothetical protein